jgi:hypothetical protein
MKTGDYHGHKTVVLENKYFRVECLAEAGPRIVRFIPQWTGENLLAELPGYSMPTARGEYRYYGGHRLWAAPESLLRTYAPDNEGLTAKEVEGGIRLEGPPDAFSGLRKSITVQMSSSTPAILVKHKLENRGNAALKLAPWGVTMMRTKGIAILPQPTGNADDDGVLPNRRLSLWTYSRITDTRLKLADDFIIVRSDLTESPFKIGYLNTAGWLGYAYDDILFVKRFGVRRDETYPDQGSNAEVYVDRRTLELESLGPLADLAPGAEIVHTETWEVFDLDKLPRDLFGDDRIEDILAR